MFAKNLIYKEQLKTTISPWVWSTTFVINLQLYAVLGKLEQWMSWIKLSNHAHKLELKLKLKSVTLQWVKLNSPIYWVNSSTRLKMQTMPTVSILDLNKNEIQYQLLYSSSLLLKIAVKCAYLV